MPLQPGTSKNSVNYTKLKAAAKVAPTVLNATSPLQRTLNRLNGGSTPAQSVSVAGKLNPANISAILAQDTSSSNIGYTTRGGAAFPSGSYMGGDGTVTPPQQNMFNTSTEKPVDKAESALSVTDQANSMANAEFGPQFQLLAKMRKDATTNYTKAGKDIGGMYATLASAIRGEAPSVKKEYKETGQDIGNAYNTAINSTKSDHAESRSATSSLAARLGVSESVPAVNAESSKQQNMLTGLMGANKANQQSLTTQLGTNESSYNRSEANTSDAAGVNAKSDFAQQLQRALQGIGNQELGLMGQKAAAKNKYSMGISSNMSDAEKWQSERDLQRERLNLDRDKFDFDKIPTTKPGDAAAQDPYQILDSTARSLYPGDEQGATNAYQIVQGAFNSAGAEGAITLPIFLDYVTNTYADSANAAPLDKQKLQRMATMFYQRVQNSKGL